MIPDKHYYNVIEALNWVQDKEGESFTSCDPGCPGWCVSGSGRGMDLTVERCDSCKRFVDDEDAFTHAMNRLKKEMDMAHWEQVGKQEAEFITDMGESRTMQNCADPDMVLKLPRYAAWGDGEVLETSGSLTYLQDKYGPLPVHELRTADISP